MKRLLFSLLLLTLELFATPSAVVKLAIKGAIGPASSHHLREGMLYAKAKDAPMLIIELDTPGGLSTSMREMIQEISNAPFPVITYVYPKGAQAASAGTYLLYASHIAAMSPATNLGAATPLSLIPTPSRPEENTSLPSTLEKKIIHDAMAYIKSLAQLNDRNASWALSAVKEAESLSAEDALKMGVIDLIAEDTQSLLKQLHGRSVRVTDQTVYLKTEGLEIEIFEADWKSRFLSIITEPNIAYIFLLIAIYGIFFELMNPGAIFPGVIGIIAAVVALYALNLIPFNYAGLLLIILGISFMISEVFVAGFGILGIGGVLSFGLGSLLLFDADTLGRSLSLSLIIAFTLSSLAFFLLVMSLFLRAREAKVVSGAEEMIGAKGVVIEAGDKISLLHCHGEIWEASSESVLSEGEKVQVVGRSGLLLHVKPIKE